MASRAIQGAFVVSDEIEDGVVRVVGSTPNMVMTMATYRALARCQGGLPRLWRALCDSQGTFRVPRSVIEPEATEDLLQGLSLVDPEPSETCIYPPCGLPSEVVRDGFRLCGHHAALMESWDDLLVG